MLSNYNIKYICTIYTRLYTCLTYIPKFALREKVTLRLLKLLFKGVDVVEGAGYKAKRMVLQCINGVSSNPVWFNFQTYIYIYIYITKYIQHNKNMLNLYLIYNIKKKNKQTSIKKKQKKRKNKNRMHISSRNKSKQQ